MKYFFSKTLNGSFEQAIVKTKNELKKQGFDVLSEIDMKSVFKNELDVDMNNYMILGICNPSFVYVAISAEDKIGTLLPCQIVIQEKKKEKIEISATNPIYSLSAVKEIDVEYIAWQIRDRLETVIENIHE